MLVNFFRPVIFPALMFVYLDKMSNLLENYVRTDTRYDKQEMLRNPNRGGSTFDFIIVGCGSAGSHLANHLSEKYKVLVLDVGGVPDPLLDIPVYSLLLNGITPVDFAHRTVPQKKAAFGLKNRVSHWPAGKQLGGSTTIHALTYNRGNVQGFDEMATELGDGKWTTKHILKYYNKIENYEKGWYSDLENHNVGGTMTIERSPVTKMVDKFIDGAVELGYSKRDPNHGPKNTEGFSFADNHMTFGRRHDAYEGNLQSIVKSRRDNLVIRKFSLVTKINFETINNTLRAVGVTYERHGRTFDVTARREVILSAGALGTAKLLMLSGIGPKDHLEKIGIQSLVDLPVGQSLQDMYGVLMGPFLVKDGYSYIRDRDVTMKTFLQWTFFGNGPLASSRFEAFYDLISNFSKTKAQKEGKDEVPDKPDIQTTVIAASADDQTATSAIDFGRAFNFNYKSLQHFSRTIGEDSFYQLVTLSSSKHTGYVKLRDSNPYTSLEIDPRYFENQDDMEVIKEGMRIAIKLAEETKSMRKIGGRLLRIPFPGCELHEFSDEAISDEYLECLARHATFTLYRYCGTAPIGPVSNSRNSNETVVDGDFRVKDVQNLRVVDASVLQLKYVTVSDSTVRMLGEFASEVILEYHKNIIDPI